VDWYPGGGSSGPTAGCVLFANNSDKAYVHDASERLGCDIRTARVVTHEFREYFFVSVRSREARLNCHLWHG
jgi:hypothetical protein